MANGLKRKQESKKLDEEKADIKRKKAEIEELRSKLANKEKILKDKEEDLDRHKIFSDFLNKVVEDKSGDKEGFESIADLQNRFKSLKNENKRLLARVSICFVLLFNRCLLYRKHRLTRRWKRLEPRRKPSSTSSRQRFTKSKRKCKTSRANLKASLSRTQPWNRTSPTKLAARIRTRRKSVRSSTPSTISTTFARCNRTREEVATPASTTRPTLK